MRWPSIKSVAEELRDVNRNVEGESDVRLQVYPAPKNGLYSPNAVRWAIRVGDSSYDQSHEGYWGASSIPGEGKKFNSRKLAEDLLDQAKEHHAQDEVK